MRLAEFRLAAGERLESIERGARLAALEKPHPGEQVALALPLGREGEDLQAPGARLEDLVGERLRRRTADLEQEAIGAAGIERPAVAHGGARGSAGEQPDRRRGIADGLVAGPVGLRREVLGGAGGRPGIVLVAALPDRRETLAGRIATRRGGGLPGR